MVAGPAGQPRRLERFWRAHRRSAHEFAPKSPGGADDDLVDMGVGRGVDGVGDDLARRSRGSGIARACTRRPRRRRDLPASPSRSGPDGPTSPAARARRCAASRRSRATRTCWPCRTPSRASVDPRAGVDEHDLAARTAQCRQQRERKCNRANDIDLHGDAPLVDRRLRDAAREGRARVVDQHVELVDRLDGGGDGVGVGQVQRPGRGAEPLRERVEPVRGPPAEKQRVSGRQRVGDGRTEAARRPVMKAVGMPVTLPTAIIDDDGTRSQLRSHAARGARRVSAARQRPGRDDHGGAAAVPAHVELGRRLRVDRPGPAERGAGRRRTRHAAVGAVVQRDDSAHRVRQRGRRLLPGACAVGDLGAGRQRAAQPAHVGHHPAAGACDRRAAHPRPRPLARPLDPRGGRGVPRPPLGRSGALAPLARRSARPEGARPGHALSRVGVRYGQLAAVGCRVRQRDSRHRAGVPARGQRHRHRRQPAAVRHGVRPLPVAARGDEVGTLRRRTAAQGDELRRRGRVRVGDPVGGLHGARRDRRGLQASERRRPRPVRVGGPVPVRASSRRPTKGPVRQGITTSGPEGGSPPRRSRSSRRCCAAGCRTTRSGRCCGCWRGRGSAGIRT